MIVINPTGVYGQGKARSYPDPTDIELEHNAWWYATRLASTINPATGDFYVPRGILGSFMYAPNGSSYSEIVDRWLYPEEWWDATEAARQGRMVERDKQPQAPGTGPYPFAAMTLRDGQFLNWLTSYDPAKYRDAWLRCVDGAWIDICRLSSSALYAGEFDPNTYDGPLQQVVVEVYGKA